MKHFILAAHLALLLLPLSTSAQETPKRYGRDYTWGNPLIIDDGVHQVITTIPRREANKILKTITHFRKAFVEEFKKDWELKAPQGLLPVYVTESLHDFQRLIKRIKKERKGTGTRTRSHAGFYMESKKQLNPCFVSMEIPVRRGKGIKVSVEGAHETLRRVIARQLAYEYAALDWEKRSRSRLHSWAIEGLCEFMANCHQRGTKIRPDLKHMEMLDEFNYSQSCYSWAKLNLAQLPSLGELFSYKESEFHGESGRPRTMSAGTAVYFFLYAGNRKYRKAYLQILAGSIRGQADAVNFGQLLPTQKEPRQLEKEWFRFVKTIRLRGDPPPSEEELQEKEREAKAKAPQR